MNPGRVFTALIAGLLLAGTGCATTGPPPLAPEHRARLGSGSDVTVVLYPPPPFRRVHPQTAVGWSAIPLFGLVAGPVAAAASEQRGLEVGEQLRIQLALVDPVERARERIVTGVAAGSLAAAPTRALTRDDPGELRATLGAGLVLDLRTTGWGILSAPRMLPGTTHQYQPYVGLRARVVQLAEARVVWQAACVSIGRDPAGKWTLEELTASGGTLLKAKLEEAGDACAEELVTRSAGRTPGS